MRADKDFRTYEQALTVVQRFGDLAEADHKNGRHQEAQYNIAHATFVGVKHLLFMAADAAIDRAEARELASKNHLATVELLALTLAACGGDTIEGGAQDEMPPTKKSEAARPVKALSGKAAKNAGSSVQKRSGAVARGKKSDQGGRHR